MGVEESKKAKASDEEIDEGLIDSIEKLQEVQDELDKVHEEANERVLQIERMYTEIRRPFYLKRSEIIKNIPGFWLTVLLNHPELCHRWTDEDQKILKYLNLLEVVDYKDPKLGYYITFNFNENPYFENSKLTKSFEFLDEGTTKITGTTIKWKEGTDAFKGVHQKKNGKKRGFAQASFFIWFSETQQKDASYIEDQADKHTDAFDFPPKFQVAYIIKEDLWPDPLKYIHDENGKVDPNGDNEEDNGDDEYDDCNNSDYKNDDDQSTDDGDYESDALAVVGEDSEAYNSWDDSGCDDDSEGS